MTHGVTRQGLRPRLLLLLEPGVRARSSYVNSKPKREKLEQSEGEKAAAHSVSYGNQDLKGRGAGSSP